MVSENEEGKEASKASRDPQPNLQNLEAARTPKFWLAIGITGVTAGIVGGLLMRLLEAVQQLVWGYRSGTLLEAIRRDSPELHLLALLGASLVVGFGALAVRKFLGSPSDSESAIWFENGTMRARPTLVQSMVSIVAVAMGVSLGRESPIKQAGGALASKIAERSGLSPAERRIVVASGVGAGMAAAYNVPVGGALFACEVLLGAISLELALPALLCSGVATAASWVLLPTGPIYVVPEFPLSKQLVIGAIFMGPLLGFAAIPFIRSLGWAQAKRGQLGRARLLAPIGVCLVLGAASIRFPELLGNGKDTVQIAYSNSLDLILLCSLPVLKSVFTAACLASGASGGLFTPCMAVGATLGSLFGKVVEKLWPGGSLGSFAVIGSCAFLASASQGPVSSLILVLELTRHVDSTMAPMLLAVAGAVLSTRLFETRSIYSIRVSSQSS